MKRLPRAAVVLLLGCVSAVQSAPYRLSPDGASVVRLEPVNAVAASSLDTGLLNTGWSASTGTGGAMSVTAYSADYSRGLGGAVFQALYDNAESLMAGQRLEWIQVIDTNVPLGGATSPYLDNAGKPIRPFYTYTAENRDPYLPENQLNFYDFSTRDPRMLVALEPDSIEWNASLYPVIWDGNASVEVRDGLGWGWTMNRATVGTTSGRFLNPTPGTAVVSGVNSNRFSWGSGWDPSWISFVGGVFDAEFDRPFTLGRLTFHNGTIPTGTEAEVVDFVLEVSFDYVPERNVDLVRAFTINNTPNSSDPIASADFLSIADLGATFNALEGETASVDILGELTSGLDILPIGSASGAAAGPIDTSGPSPGNGLKIVGIAHPSGGGFISDVPEPSVIALSVLGMAPLVFGRGRRFRARRDTHRQPWLGW